MSEIAERYDRVSQAFLAKVAATPDDRWDRPSPCEGWTALDVVRHVVDGHGLFLGFIGHTLPEPSNVDDDPVAAMASARETMLGLLQDPRTATQTYEGHLGTRTFEWGVDNFLSFDLVVHGWDLARATGQDETIDPAEAKRLLVKAQEWGEMARAPGVFGPEIEPPPDADIQTRLLAFVGRRA